MYIIEANTDTYSERAGCRPAEYLAAAEFSIHQESVDLSFNVKGAGDADPEIVDDIKRKKDAAKRNTPWRTNRPRDTINRTLRVLPGCSEGERKGQINGCVNAA